MLPYIWLPYKRSVVYQFWREIRNMFFFRPSSAHRRGRELPQGPGGRHPGRLRGHRPHLPGEGAERGRTFAFGRYFRGFGILMHRYSEPPDANYFFLSGGSKAITLVIVFKTTGDKTKSLIRQIGNSLI